MTDPEPVRRARRGSRGGASIPLAGPLAGTLNVGEKPARDVDACDRRIALVEFRLAEVERKVDRLRGL